MAKSKKATILNRVVREGHSSSYGTVLYATALMSTDPKNLEPRSTIERANWDGHFAGLRAALHSMAMQELEIDSDAAAVVVDSQINEAIHLLDRNGSTEAGERAVAYWSQSYAGIPECVADVRKFTRTVIGDGQGADLVELIASELASNAIRHSHSGEPEGQFTLHLATFVDRWSVRVDDAGGPSTPHICRGRASSSIEDIDEYEGDVEVGRGLFLVESVASKWGVYGDTNARAVWAEVERPGRLTRAGAVGVG